jgi:hypothetical protein
VPTCSLPLDSPTSPCSAGGAPSDTYNTTSREGSTLADIYTARRESTRCVVAKPIIGRALPTTCVAVIPTLVVSGSAVSGLLTAVMVYPFVHLYFRWLASKG